MNDDRPYRQRARLADFERFKNALADLSKADEEAAESSDEWPPASDCFMTKAQMWLDRAAEIRRFAQLIEGGYGRLLLLGLADDYERLARGLPD